MNTSDALIAEWESMRAKKPLSLPRKKSKSGVGAAKTAERLEDDPEFVVWMNSRELTMEDLDRMYEEAVHEPK